MTSDFIPQLDTYCVVYPAGLGDRNDNRIYLDYDEADGLVRLRDTFDLTQVELIRDPLHVTRIERVYPDHAEKVLASYDYDAIGNLAEVRDAERRVKALCL